MASRGASLALALAAGCGGAGDGDDAPADAGAPQQLTITLRDRDGAAASNATLLAVRDGEGAWRQVEGQAGVYTSTVHGSYGVFIGCDDADPALDDTYTTDDTRFYFRHPDDGFEVELPGCRPHKVYVSGTIEGLGSEDNVGVGGVRYRSGDASYRAAVTPGPVELLVVDWLPALRVPRMLRHDLGVVDTDLVHDVSLDEAVGAASVPLDVRGAAAGDDLIIVGQLRTQAGPVGAWATSGRGGRPNSLAILPTSLRKHGDVIDATVRLTTFGNPRSMQVALIRDVDAAVTVELPPPLDIPVPTILSVTAAAFALPATTLAPDELLVVNVHGATHVTTSWRIEASAAWTNHAQVLEVSWMDHLPAWSPDWVIEMGSASWSVVVQNETSQRGIQGTFWPFD